jgi:hypothetical protein
LATTEWIPGVGALIVSLATPELSRLAEPSGDPLSVKLTTPVVWGPSVLITIPLNVIGSPTVGVASVVLNDVVVVAWAIVSLTAFDVPGASFMSPAY